MGEDGHERQRFPGVTVPDPAYADDDGAADPDLARVLAAYADGDATERDVVVGLQGRRLMVPLVAVLDDVGMSDSGHAVEKASHMATVSLVSRDGRRGLLAFTSVDALEAWDPAARGIPTDAARAASAAVEDGADALLLDLAGPVRVALSGASLLAAAAGRNLHADTAVREAVVSALDGVPGLGAAVLETGDGHLGGSGPDLVVVLEVLAGADPSAVVGVVARRLSHDAVLAARCPAGVGISVLDPPAG